jgi:hypothetical protein
MLLLHLFRLLSLPSYAAQLTFTTRQVKFVLHKPLKATAESGAYQRVVFKFRYDNYELLRRLQNRVMVNNGKVLGFPTDNPSMLAKTLATVQLTDAQAKDPSLDLITGFELIDPGFRLMILEGLGAGAMKSLIAENPRQSVNNADLTILYHPDVTFAERLYTAFNAVVFKVKLSDSLKNIIYSPDIYLLPKFASCAAAIMRVAEVSRAKRMIRLRDLKLFPSALQILKLDKKFGSVLNNRDIDGSENARVRKVETSAEGGATASSSPASPTKKAASATVAAASSNSVMQATSSSARELHSEANPLGLVDTTGAMRRWLTCSHTLKLPPPHASLLAGLSLVEAKLARARARRLASTIPTQNSNLDFVEHLQRRALKKRPDYVSQNIAKVGGEARRGSIALPAHSGWLYFAPAAAATCLNS